MEKKCKICGQIDCAYMGEAMDRREENNKYEGMIKVGDWIKYKDVLNGGYTGAIYAGEVKEIYNTKNEGLCIVLGNGVKLTILDIVEKVNMDKEKDANEKMEEFLNKEKDKCPVCGLYTFECTCIIPFIKEKDKEDNVNHPKHYTFGKYEVVDVLEDWGLDKDFYLGNTVKYIARAKHKGHELQDLKKAQWYLNRKIARLEKEK